MLTIVLVCMTGLISVAFGVLVCVMFRYGLGNVYAETGVCYYNNSVFYRAVVQCFC